MGARSDWKKVDELSANDLNKGCRQIVDQSTCAHRRLKKVLRRQARKRLKEGRMKFIIITTNGTRIIEADDFDEAADEAYDSHTGYRDVQAIVKMPEE